MNSPTVVTVREARVLEDGQAILDIAELDVATGELVGVTGSTNTGKTTLIHMLAGIQQLDEGTIAWLPKRRPRWNDVSLVPQSIALIDELTVGENIDFARRATRAARKRDNDDVLESLGLDRLRDRLVTEISVGERQRTMVARALLGPALLFLADEPTAHQDQHHAEAVIAAIHHATRNGRAAVIATRDPANLLDLDDRVITLSRTSVAD